jgi:protein SCO1/2
MKLLATTSLATTARVLGVAALVASAAIAAPAMAQGLTAQELAARVGIEQMLGADLPGHLEFVDETGTRVALADYLGDKPVILSLVYYECPMLCGVAMEGLIRNLKVLGLELGKDFQIVNVSINPDETPQIAASKKADYLGSLGDPRPEIAAGWHALTGEQASIDALAEAVGFRYVYDPETDEYAHGAAIMLVTPEGTLSRYFYGVTYPARDLRLGIVEAAGGGVGSITDQVLLLCYQYDPVSGKYNFAVWAALRMAGVLTIAILLIFIMTNLRRERTKRYEAVATAGGTYERK